MPREGGDARRRPAARDGAAHHFPRGDTQPGTAIGQVDAAWHRTVGQAVAPFMYQSNGEIGSALRRLRERAGLSQRQAAARWGLPQSTIAKVEVGSRGLSLIEAGAIALHEHAAVAELLPAALQPLFAELRGPAGEPVAAAAAVDPVPCLTRRGPRSP